MPRQILRRKDAYARFSVKRTKFDEDFVLRADDDPFVPGTDDSVLRLRRSGWAHAMSDSSMTRRSMQQLLHDDSCRL